MNHDQFLPVFIACIVPTDTSSFLAMLDKETSIFKSIRTASTHRSQRIELPLRDPL